MDATLIYQVSVVPNICGMHSILVIVNLPREGWQPLLAGLRLIWMGRLTLHRVNTLQLANVQVHGRACAVLGERVRFASFYASTAKRALARVVAPREFVLGARKVIARAVQRNLQMAHPVQSSGLKHTSPRYPSLTMGRSGNRNVRCAASQVAPQHGKDIHDRSLISNVDEMARTAQEQGALPIKARSRVDGQSRGGGGKHRQQQDDSTGAGDEQQCIEPPFREDGERSAWPPGGHCNHSRPWDNSHIASSGPAYSIMGPE